MSATHIHTFGSPASKGTMVKPPDETRRVREERIHNARSEKAKALALSMRSLDITAETAARLSDGGWAAAGDIAKVRMEGRGARRTVSQSTRSAVVAILSILEDLDELRGDG